jgi:ABC-2 type transport system permease protein
MKTIIYLLQKEFIQVFRNRTMLPIIFVVPAVQLVILVFAANLEMKSIKMCVVDKDLSPSSRKLVSSFDGSPFYKIENSTFSIAEAEYLLQNNKADVILHIPAGFEKKLVRENQSKIQLLINSINSMSAGLINGYSTAVMADYNNRLRAEWFDISKANIGRIDVIPQYWFNKELDYKIFMIPGILVVLVTIMGMFLAAMNLVREKELGTIEQINVTPIKKYQFLIGKLLPFWMIAMFELSLGLAIGRIFFHLPVEGSLWVLFAVASVYLFVAMGIGLFISTVTQTQQQVMFMSWFFMITFIMMSGIFTPAESMPDWAQKINIINPFAYFIRANRMILLKGSGFHDVLKEFISLSVYAAIILSLAVWKYRKTT